MRPSARNLFYVALGLACVVPLAQSVGFKLPGLPKALTAAPAATSSHPSVASELYQVDSLASSGGGSNAETGESDLSRLEEELSTAAAAGPLAPDFEGTDVNLITGTETYPNVTQNQATTWGHGNTVVVTYDDSRGRNASPFDICGASVSTDGGASFMRLTAATGQSPFSVGQTCYGFPTVLYSVRSGKWYVSALTSRCGGFGIGQWVSATPSDPAPASWPNSGCILNSSGGDLHTTWVDNSPASPFYGRQYAAFNNFGLGSFPPPQVARSTDDGATWSAPVTLSSGITTFRRAVKVTGSLGADGTVFVQTQNEPAGGLTPRQNVIYRSTDGGVTWSQTIQNTFDAPGRTLCTDNTYFPCMYASPAYWREIGWGQLGVGPGVVHYVHSARVPATGDPGNIYYIRSTDQGATWSSPLRLNTDATLRAQWSPSLSVNASGQIFASWYDERNTAGRDLQYFGRASTDNGATWGPEIAVSDVVFPVPLQPDPGIFASQAGYLNHAMFGNDGYGSVAYHAWTDGRVSISGSPQQDVFFDKIDFTAVTYRFLIASSDFDGDGVADKAVFRPGPGTFGTWYVKKSNGSGDLAVQWGASGDIPAAGNYAGDARADFTIFRPSTGTWWVLSAEGVSQPPVQWGTSGDVPVPGQYGGDGRTDFAVWRPSNGTWYVRTAEGSQPPSVQWGTGGDIPVPGDYDGDGITDMAVFRPSNGIWYVKFSGGATAAIAWGASGDIPVAADFTGDGRADYGIFRPSTGTWYVKSSANLSELPSVAWGAPGDVPLPAQIAGDSRADDVVWRPSNGSWYVRSAEGLFPPSVAWGTSGDIPVAH